VSPPSRSGWTRHESLIEEAREDRVSEGPYVTTLEIVNVGRELRAELARAAREEQRDVTSLARLIVREWLDARSADLTRRNGQPGD
jgi:hypothetical protein